MGEFFGNLVARSMGDAGRGAILRPRLPSLFETPDSVAMPLAGREPVPGEMEGDFPSGEPANGEGGETPFAFFDHTESSSPAARGETSSRRRLQTRRRDGQGVSDEGEGGDLLESIPSLRQSTRGEHRPAQPEQSAGEPRRHLAELITSRREEVGLAGPLLSEGAVMERVPREKQPSQVNAPDADLAIRPRIERYQGILEKPPVLSIDPGGRGEDGKPDTERYGQSAKEAQAPTVHISIGRIEVRAVTQPTPQPAPRPVRQQSRMGLADYLRQRNEGKR